MIGKLIVFEGGEGSGKSTQLRLLEQYLGQSTRWHWLRQTGVVDGLVTTREPGGTPLGISLRQLLLNQLEDVTLGSQAELLLYAADRAQHVQQLIQPALSAGYWVLCDRFIDSTVAYQGYGRGLDLALIEQLNQIATGGLTPDLTLWLELDAATGLVRSHRRGAVDRMEQADLAFHQRVYQGFKALAQQYPQRIVAIPAAGSVEAVSQTIQTVVEQHLQQWYPDCLTA
jgi:dTMP kinase